MKHLFCITILLSSLLSFSQKWTLNNFDAKKEYSYEYWFQFQHTEDKSSYQITPSNSDKNLVELRTSKNDTIYFPVLKITDTKTDSSHYIFDDFGKIKPFKLPQSNYLLTVSAQGFKSIEIPLEIADNSALNIKIKLGLQAEEEVYQIDSKVELSELEILEIMSCVKENRKLYFTKCSQSNKHNISIHL